MRRPSTLRITGLILSLLVALIATPSAAMAVPGISVAPSAGPPGAQFVVTGAGFAPGARLSVLVERGMVFSRTFEATAGADGRFELTLDSTGFAESINYSVSVFPRGGGAGLGSTRFAVTSAQSERCFDETGRCVRGRFLAYWESHGALPINGFPISDEFSEVLEDGRPYTVQYFERTRLEYHPENQPPFDVLLGQFGRRIRPTDPPTMAVDERYFTETGHNLGGRFLAYWDANGGLPQFGYPISEVIEQRLEDGRIYRVQYFERARFELHPENQAPYDVLLGQFGRLILAQSGRPRN